MFLAWETEGEYCTKVPCCVRGTGVRGRKRRKCGKIVTNRAQRSGREIGQGGMTGSFSVVGEALA
jgi:hypothetical protein